MRKTLIPFSSVRGLVYVGKGKKGKQNAKKAILDALEENPAATTEEIAELVGCSERYVQKVRKKRRLSSPSEHSMNCGVLTIRHTVRSFRRELAANKADEGSHETSGSYEYLTNSSELKDWKNRARAGEPMRTEWTSALTPRQAAPPRR